MSLETFEAPGRLFERHSDVLARDWAGAQGAATWQPFVFHGAGAPSVPAGILNAWSARALAAKRVLAAGAPG